MRRSKEIFEMSYYSTYYYANILQNVIMNPIDYLKSFEEFLVVSFKISNKFKKFGVLHRYIYFVIDALFYEDINDELMTLSNENLDININEVKDFWLNRALNFHDISHLIFHDWLKENEPSFYHSEDIVYEYIDYLFDAKYKLINKLTEEVFYLLFMNRKLLLEFNKLIASHISQVDLESKYIDNELKPLFKRNGVLKRVYIPKWVKSAVFFRDRGHCVFCNADLTNLITRLSVKNFDHIVPLNLGGINDISNIQLTCQKCNQDKKGKESITTNRYEVWY